MVCKFCGSEMIEGEPLCPQCGKAQDEPVIPVTEQLPEEMLDGETEAIPEVILMSENEAIPEDILMPENGIIPEETEPPQEEKHVSKTALGAAIVALLLVIGLVIAIWQIGGKKEPVDPEDPSETVAGEQYTDEEKEVVVATLNGRELTVGELQIYYWMDVWNFLDQNQYYLAYMGLDLTKPFGEQPFGEDGKTWQDYFLDRALQAWQEQNVLCTLAEESDFRLNQEDLDFLSNLDNEIEELAKTNGLEDAKELVLRNFGPLATVQGYKNYVTNYYIAISYYANVYQGLEFTQEELEAYFTENAEDLAEQGITKDTRYVDVRHILLMPEGGTVGEDGSTVTYSDEEWAACLEKAQEVYEKWKNGDATEDSFAQLATEYTEDPGSQSTGGLYADVTEGWAVAEFNDWCFDAEREPGDHDLVKTSYGYHIMYFVSSKEAWIDVCKEKMADSSMNDLIDSAIKKYPMETDQDNLRIGNVDMA